MYIDSHCHLNLLDLAKLGDLATVLKYAWSCQVTRVLSVATDLTQHDELLTLAHKYSMVDISTGLHPEHASEIDDQDKFFDKLSLYAQAPEVVAIGETGLDYFHWESYDDATIASAKKIQQDIFTLHLNVAIKSHKPLIIHSRMAPDDTINVLTRENGKFTGVMHCFTESWDLARKALDLGLYISFSGIITFKHKVEDLLAVVKKIPLDRILIETDSPYLAPVPFRGKQNQPAYVPYIAAKIAAVKQIKLETVAEATYKNYMNLFQK